MLWLIVVASLCGVVYLSYMRKRVCTYAVQLPFLSKMRGGLMPLPFRIMLFGIEILAVFFFSLLVLYCIAGSGPLKGTYAAFFDFPQRSTDLSRKIFFVLDRSGSMAEPMPGSTDTPKMTVAKDGIFASIKHLDEKGGGKDLLGLATFARAERVVAPLTKDRGFFSEVLASVLPETIEALNGTAIGYAIFKATALIVACSDIGSSEKFSSEPTTVDSTIIVLTDGLEEPHPADLSHPYRSMRSIQALRVAKDNHVCVHYINVDKTSYQRMAADERDRLIEAIEATGGSYHEAMSKAQVSDTLKAIIVGKSAEKVTSEFDNNGVVIVFLLTMTMFMLFVGRGMETIVLRVAR